MSDDEVWLEVEMPPEVLRLMPPDRYAVPASTMPLLERWTAVTWGEPGGWWIVDAGVVAAGPDLIDGVEHYTILPWASTFMKAMSGSTKTAIQLPVSDLWVYREVESEDERLAIDLEPWHPHMWFDRVLDDDLTPPPLLKARPARELPSLNGRMLRYYDFTKWNIYMAVSEPLRDAAGDLWVKCVHPFLFFRLAATGRPENIDEPLADRTVIPLRLEALWAY